MRTGSPMRHTTTVLALIAATALVSACDQKKSPPDGTTTPALAAPAATDGTVAVAAGTTTAPIPGGTAAPEMTPGSPAAAAGEMTEAELTPRIEAWVLLMEKVVAAADAAKTDCAALAVSLAKLHTESKALLDESDRIRANPANLKLGATLIGKYQARLEASESKVMPCMRDPKVQQEFMKTIGDPGPVAGGAPDQPVGPTLSEADLAPKLERFAALYEQLAAAFAASHGDCAGLVKAINAVITDNQPFLVESRALRANPANRATAQAIGEALAPRVMAAEKTMADGVGTCKDDPAIEDALNRFMM